MKIFAAAVAIALTAGAQSQTAAQQDQQPMPGMQMQQQHAGRAPSSDSMPNQEEELHRQLRKPTAENDATSASHATMPFEEPENPGYRTGENLPAPELLNDAAKREPVSLQQFEEWAEKGNPTLAQAHALVRRSEQQGHQASLYPNPSIAYDGEHIRGGSYGGGEQGAYVQQTVVLGGKLGLRRDIYQQQARADRAGADEQGYRVRNGVQQAF